MLTASACVRSSRESVPSTVSRATVTPACSSSANRRRVFTSVVPAVKYETSLLREDIGFPRPAITQSRKTSVSA